MGVLDATVDDRNNSPCSQDVLSVQLLHTRDAMDQVFGGGSIITEGLALDRVQNPHACRLVDRSHGAFFITGVLERRPERARSAGMVTLDAHAGEEV